MAKNLKIELDIPDFGDQDVCIKLTLHKSGEVSITSPSPKTVEENSAWKQSPPRSVTPDKSSTGGNFMDINF